MSSTAIKCRKAAAADTLVLTKPLSFSLRCERKEKEGERKEKGRTRNTEGRESEVRASFSTCYLAPEKSNV